MTACRLAWSVGLGGRRGLFEFPGRDTNTRFVFNSNGQKLLLSQILIRQATGLLVLNYPDSYVHRNWHGTLLTIAILGLSVTFNTFFAQKLHLVVCVLQAKLTISPMLIYILGDCCSGIPHCWFLFDSHSTMGALRESPIARSVDDLLRSRMGQSRLVLLDWHRCQCRSFAWG